MRTNIVLVDYENVQPDSFALLAEDHFRVIVFIGATQTKLPVELVEAMMRMGSRAELVRIAGTGPNALDFHVAFRIGEIAAKETNVFFHIISKDTGFDPLIKYLKTERKVFCVRSECLCDIPMVKAGNGRAAEERAEQFAHMLRLPKATKPRTERTLSSAISTFFNKQLNDQEVSAVVGAMRKSGLITLDGTKVAYSLAG